MQPLLQPTGLKRPPATVRLRASRHGWGAALLLTGWGLAWVCGPCAAELYRWVDETGTTVYSQVPPPRAVPATTIKPSKGPPPTTREPAAEQLREAIEQDFDQRQEQARQAAEAAEKATAQATRQSNCETARANLETLQKHGQGRVRLPEKEARFLSREELETLEAQAQREIRDNCD